MRLYKSYLIVALCLSLVGSTYGLWNNFWQAYPSSWKTSLLGKYFIYPLMNREFSLETNLAMISTIQQDPKSQKLILSSLKAENVVLYSIDELIERNGSIIISGWVYYESDPIIGVAMIEDNQIVGMKAIDVPRPDLERLYGGKALVSGFRISNYQFNDLSCNLIAISKSFTAYFLKNICEKHD